MTEQQNYLLRMCIVIPMLPLLILQGKYVRRNIPSLPEAIEPTGAVIRDSEKVIRVIGIGESTMAGVGVKTHADGFIGAFTRHLATNKQMNVDWKVYAKNGMQVRKVEHRLLQNISEQDADIVIVALGANDAFNLRSPKYFEIDINRLIDRLQSRFPTSPIVFTNMPPIHMFPAFPRFMRWVMSGFVDLYRRVLVRIVNDFPNVFFNDERIELATWSERYEVDVEPAKLFSDGVHPSHLTYALWGQDMARFVTTHSIDLDP